MGVKNLSYCKLLFGPKLKPTVTEWTKIDLSQRYTLEKFSPLLFSRIAYDLTKELMQDQDAIVIEEQRSRTQGGSLVQEWTLRVNMLQQMIISTVHSLQREGQMKGVLSLSNPSRMHLTFVLRKIENKKAQKQKQQRIEYATKYLLRSLRGGSSPMVLSEELKKLIKARDIGVNEDSSTYLHKLLMNESDGKVKSDDLADSLLHALANVKWFENREIFRQGVKKNRNIPDIVDEITRNAYYLANPSLMLPLV